jgi:hypothetical protein
MVAYRPAGSALAANLGRPAGIGRFCAALFGSSGQISLADRPDLIASSATNLLYQVLDYLCVSEGQTSVAHHFIAWRCFAHLRAAG